jgi:hypothetical protein
MRSRSIAIVVIAGALALVAGCGGGSTPSAAVPSDVPSDAPSGAPSSGAGVTLQPALANLGCDTVAPSYSSVTFHIDATKAADVTATTNAGATLKTFWSEGFVGGVSDVQDPSGQVVVTDGEVLDIPQGAFPRLKGYFVCPSAAALYVLLQDPS